MSTETVLKRCMENVPDMDVDLVTKDIELKATRFERIVKTSYNESLGSFHRTYGIDKDAEFEKHKLERIHNHLEMLIDLFDYDKEEA